MNEIIFFTYIISVMALGISLYVAMELYYLKKEQQRKQVQKKLHQEIQQIKPKTKGHWG